MEEETVKKCVEEIGEKFKEKPLSYLTESDIELEIASKLREREPDRKPSVELKKENCTKYKEPYIKKIVNSSLGSSVHTEVNLGKRNDNYLIDIGVFKEEVKGVIDGGTKRFTPKSIEHALEIKFIKNKNNVQHEYFETELEKFQKKLDKSTKSYLVVFSNKNRLENGERTHAGVETKRKLEEKAEAEERGIWFKHYHPPKK